MEMLIAGCGKEGKGRGGKGREGKRKGGEGREKEGRKGREARLGIYRKGEMWKG